MPPVHVAAATAHRAAPARPRARCDRDLGVAQLLGLEPAPRRWGDARRRAAPSASVARPARRALRRRRPGPTAACGTARSAPTARRAVPLSSDAALVDDDDAVGERERRPPVRDQDRRARAGDPPQRRVDLLLDAGVDRRGRVVEQQDPRIGEQRARERDALALTAREREALLADDGVVALRAGA